MKTHRLFLAVYVSLVALWSDTAQSIALKPHEDSLDGDAPATDAVVSAVEPKLCDYFGAKKESKTGNDGKELEVVEIRDEDWKGPPKGDKTITMELICAFKKMQADAAAEKVELKIVSGLRTPERQAELWEKSGCVEEADSSISCATGPFITKPGTSEHGSGNALDIALPSCGKCHANCKKDSHPDEACEKSPELIFLRKHAAKDYHFFSPIKGSPGHFVYARDLLTPVTKPQKHVSVPLPVKGDTGDNKKRSNSAPAGGAMDQDLLKPVARVRKGSVQLPTKKDTGDNKKRSSMLVVPKAPTAKKVVTPKKNVRNSVSGGERCFTKVENKPGFKKCPKDHYPRQDRLDCWGFKDLDAFRNDDDKVRKKACEERPCCWQPLEHDSPEPWCFRKPCFEDLSRIKPTKEGKVRGSA